MAKSLKTGEHTAEAQSVLDRTPEVRVFSPDDFEADTQEDRSISVLAEKRRQFLARLNAREGDLPADQ